MRDPLLKFLLKFFRHQTLYWISMDLRFLVQRILQKVRFKNPAKIKQNARFLNVGCGAGGLKSEDWYNVDMFPADSVDYLCDTSRELPFPDCRFQGIYTEHLFEHLTPSEARVFLTECLRVLVPGGVLRLSVPDGALYLKKYEDHEWMLSVHGDRFSTPMQVVNQVFRQCYEHQYCYDYETLSLLLEEVGYVRVERVDYRKGTLSELLIDQPSRRFESLYVEGQCPELTSE